MKRRAGKAGEEGYGSEKEREKGRQERRSDERLRRGCQGRERKEQAGGDQDESREGDDDDVGDDPGERSLLEVVKRDGAVTASAAALTPRAPGGVGEFRSERSGSGRQERVFPLLPGGNQGDGGDGEERELKADLEERLRVVNENQDGGETQGVQDLPLAVDENGGRVDGDHDPRANRGNGGPRKEGVAGDDGEGCQGGGLERRDAPRDRQDQPRREDAEEQHGRRAADEGDEAHVRAGHGENVRDAG